MLNPWYVGVDIGGTTIKMAFIDTTGEIISKWEIPTNKQNSQQIVNEINQAIMDRLKELNEGKERLAGIGVGAPGFINMETGFIYKAVNIGWEDYPLKDLLEELTGLPVVVDNDANLAAIGEMWLGAGDLAKDLLAVTLGTGVGGGIITNGNIVHGKNGMAGEIGHITSITKNGFPCNCGKSGCLETISSATGIARIATEKVTSNPDSQLYVVYNQNGQLTAKDVFDAAYNEDTLALEIVDEISFHLGLAIANISNTINPEKIVIGGGVSRAGDLLITYVDKYFKQFSLPRVYEGANIVIATLGNDAGVIGAVWLIKQKVTI